MFNFFLLKTYSRGIHDSAAAGAVCPTSSDVHEQDWKRHPVDPYHTLLKVLTIL